MLDEKLLVFVLGAPGAGKGTQCDLIVKEYGWTHISAGDLLRAQVSAGTAVGKEAEEYLKQGTMVPASMIIGLLKDALSEAQHTKVLIDGFPRVLSQLKEFEQQVRPCDKALFYNVPEEVARDRLLKRGETSGRVDDNEDTIHTRFVVFKEESMPVITELQQQGRCEEIEAAQPPEQVFGATRQVIEQLEQQQTSKHKQQQAEEAAAALSAEATPAAALAAAAAADTQDLSAAPAAAAVVESAKAATPTAVSPVATSPIAVAQADVSSPMASPVQAAGPELADLVLSAAAAVTPDAAADLLASPTPAAAVSGSPTAAAASPSSAVPAGAAALAGAATAAAAVTAAGSPQKSSAVQLAAATADDNTAAILAGAGSAAASPRVATEEAAAGPAEAVPAAGLGAAAAVAAEAGPAEAAPAAAPAASGTIASLQMDLSGIRTPVVICGPSGVGKGTLISKLMTQFADRFGFSVSHTTRDPRPGEEHGKHYFFTDKDSMAAQVAAGMFLEHANVHGNMYGTSLAAVAQVSAAGKHCVLDIDVQGAAQVRKSALGSQCLFIFVAPPSHEELERRLRNRGTETEEKVLQRLANAESEIAKAQEPGLFHHVLVNAELEVAYQELLKLVAQRVPGLLPESQLQQQQQQPATPSSRQASETGSAAANATSPAAASMATSIASPPAAAGAAASPAPAAADAAVVGAAAAATAAAVVGGVAAVAASPQQPSQLLQPALANGNGNISVSTAGGTATLLDFGFGASAGPAVAAKGMPVRQYMDATVIPVLREGLKALNVARPDDPLQFLADYLVAHKAAAA